MHMQKSTLIAFLLLQCSMLLAQQHDERPDQAYLPPVVSAVASSPAYQFTGPNFLIRQVNVNPNGNNILNDAANEPSIAVSPADPKRMVIGWRQFDNISSSFRQAGMGYSTNGGESWTFPGVIDPGVFRSDPVLASDENGRFYYNSLTVNGNDFSCDVYRSTGDGTWDAGVYAIGGDKQWMILDTTSGPGNGNIYAQWNINYTACVSDGNYTRSTDEGDSYEDCGTITPNVFWGTCAVGPDGMLYVSSAGGVLARSIDAQDPDAGTTWLEGGYFNLNGDIPGDWNGQHPNPAGLLGQNWVAVNTAPGPLYNQVYVLQSVRPFAADDPADVMFARSEDGGLTWSAPVRINQDGEGNWQWFGTMSVAPNGRIDVVWLDTRDHPGTVMSSLYYAYSTDGGLSWSDNERLSEAFDPHLGWPQQQKMGDYFHMVSDNESAHLAWTATFNGEEDVYYSRITLPLSSSHQAEKIDNTMKASPNPASGRVQISLDTDVQTPTMLRIFDRQGRLLNNLMAMPVAEGKQLAEWDGLLANGRRAPAGLYFCQEPQSGRLLKLALID